MFDALRSSLYAAAVFKPEQPDQPNPYEVARAQSDANIRTAKEQAKLGMTGQNTPWGSIQYVTDPNSPSGYRAVTNLTPEQQALFEQGQGIQGQFGDILSDQIGRVGETIGGPFDLNAARGNEIADIQRTFLDPQWSERRAAMEADLTNRGIRMGSPAFTSAMRDFEDQRSGAYDRMFLDAYSTANNAALTERNLPLADLAAIRGTAPTQVGMPQFGNTPQPGVAPTDVTGTVMNAYNTAMGSYNAGMGGLYGMGSAALGGWAQAGFPGIGAAIGMLSDRRVKTNVRHVEDDPRGWGVYEFEYIKEVGAPGKFIGFMVDEVEPSRPDAIIEHPSGFKMINYEALAQ